MATKYFALVFSLTARSNEITQHHSDGILEGEVTPKSCTSVTDTADKIVVALWEKSAAVLIFRLGGGGLDRDRHLRPGRQIRSHSPEGFLDSLKHKMLLILIKS